MTERGDYDIRTDDKNGQLALIDIGAEAAAHEPWFNQTPTTVNDAVVRLGVFHGGFHFHKHDAEDELFMALEGELLFDVEGQGTITLGPHQASAVPQGVTHRTRSPERSVVLVIEARGVQPTGDRRLPLTRPRRTDRPVRSRRAGTSSSLLCWAG